MEAAGYGSEDTVSCIQPLVLDQPNVPPYLDLTDISFSDTSTSFINTSRANNTTALLEDTVFKTTLSESIVNTTANSNHSKSSDHNSPSVIGAENAPGVLSEKPQSVSINPPVYHLAGKLEEEEARREEEKRAEELLRRDESSSYSSSSLLLTPETKRRSVMAHKKYAHNF